MTYLDWLAQQDLETCTFKEAFQAGAASRDAEVARLEQTIAFQKAAWTTDYEERDQLREQVAALEAQVERYWTVIQELSGEKP